MDAAVHLEGLRCDGAAYGGCDAACLIFWKEAWLTPVSGPYEPGTAPVAVSSHERNGAEQEVWDARRAPTWTEEEPVYRCQATCLPEATRPLAWWDVRQYAQDYSSRNVTLKELVAGLVYVLFYTAVRAARKIGVESVFVRVYDRFQRLHGGVPFPRKRGRVGPGERTPTRRLEVEPGDQIRVKSYDGILDTLDGSNKNRGLYFDAEEVPYCGQTLRVRSRVSRIVDEKTGRLVTIGGNTLILEDTWCRARYSDRRMFCPRAIYSFWRDTWLDPVEPHDGVTLPRG
jgi:hypothetical protein